MFKFSKDFLHREYVELKKSLYQIANEQGCLPRTVRLALIRNSIPLRRSRLEKTIPPKDELYHIHVDLKATPYHMADHYGVAPATIKRWLERYEIPVSKHQQVQSPERDTLYNLHVIQMIPVTKLAQQFETSPRTVLRWLKEADIERVRVAVFNGRKSATISDSTNSKKIDRLVVKDLYVDQQLSAVEIAKRLGVRPVSIYRVLKQLEITTRKLPNKIDTNFRELILQDYRSGETTLAELGQKHGVSGSTIGKWLPMANITANPQGRSSAFERWLKKQLGGDFRSDRKTMGFELDLYSQNHQMAVELCGMYWHSEQRGYYPKNYHYNKYLSCRTSGITLLTIFEDEWLKNRDLVLSIVESKLGKFTKRIAARKCKVQPLSSSTAKSFFDQFHIQGGCQSTESAGLIHNDELVAAMSLGPHHRDSKTLVLNRLCFAPRTQVIGGASRLLSHLTKGRALVSWSDNRWSTGKVYEELGFKLDREYGPDYSYTNNRERLHKQRFKKSLTGCPPDIKEADWCRERGWYRIWDCGKKRWVLDPQ